MVYDDGIAVAADPAGVYAHYRGSGACGEAFHRCVGPGRQYASIFLAQEHEPGLQGADQLDPEDGKHHSAYRGRESRVVCSGE